MAGQEDPVQREIHQDWANREYIEVITSSIKKIADFLNSFVPAWLSERSMAVLLPCKDSRRLPISFRIESKPLSSEPLSRSSGPSWAVCVFVSGMALILNVSLLLPDMSCRSRLATLNEKLTALERRIEYIEARVSMMGKGLL
ncbi:hypothetical protein DBR06_SOUSAS1610039, partial [Sousa chinensis]